MEEYERLCCYRYKFSSNNINLEFVGIIQIKKLVKLIGMAEKMVNRKISHKIYSRGEAFEFNIDPSKDKFIH